MADDAGSEGVVPASGEADENLADPPQVQGDTASGTQPPEMELGTRPGSRWCFGALKQPAPRMIAWGAAAIGLCAVIALDFWFMVRSAPQNAMLPAASTEAEQHAAPPAESSTPAAPAPSSGVEQEQAATPAPNQFFQDEGVGVEALGRQEPKEPRHYATVGEAAARSCSTGSVDGLSRQIIKQARCINPRAFVLLPSRPNLVIGPNVFPYLEAAARDHLLRALASKRNKTMTINSALRTVAQQYLVRRWSANKRCGVQLATQPGGSNHETGLALDIAEHAAWRPALEAQHFKWLGSIDRVHFDYKGNGAVPRRMMDVRAFQQLYNRNHPDDSITESGLYDAATDQRLKNAPADGFPIGPRCGKRPARKKPARRR